MMRKVIIQRIRGVFRGEKGGPYPFGGEKIVLIYNVKKVTLKFEHF